MKEIVKKEYSKKEKIKITAFAVFVLTVIILLFFSSSADAGTTGVVFKPAYDWIVGSLQGYGGKIAAVLMLFVGLFIAALTKSLMYPLLAIAIAFFIAYGVAIINGIATAVI